MPVIKGIDKNQILLLSLDAMVAPNSSARLIGAFVDALECAKAGTGEPAKTGRPPYDRKVLLKLCLYGYVDNIRSTGELARECQVNLEAMWLINGTAPDFNTIDSFVKDNADLLQDVFYEFNLRVNGEAEWGFEPAAGTKLYETGLKAKTLPKEKREARVKNLKGRMRVYLAALAGTDSRAGAKKKPAYAGLPDITAKPGDLDAFYEGVYEDCPKKLKKH